mgnify:CR=1 FL=1
MQTEGGEQSAQYPLGPLEDLFWPHRQSSPGRRHRRDFSPGLGIVQPEPLAGALTILQKCHPGLRARIGTGADSKACYEVFSSMAPLPVRVKHLNERELP